MKTTVAVTTATAEQQGPKSSKPRTWIRRLLSGGQLREKCPSFCTDSHLGDDVATSLDDLQHGASLPGVEVEVDDCAGIAVPLPFLGVRIVCDPYSEDAARNVPHIVMEMAEDTYTVPMAPEAFLAVVGKLRAHLDVLEGDALRQLRAALAEHGVSS